MNTKLAALAAAFALAAPLAANAQDVPSYASDQGYNDDAQIRGRIVAFDGDFNLQVRDDRGYVDNVELHQGTIINPTGLTLAPGMVVSILGYNSGPYFAANEVDTPYNYYGGVPYYAGHPYSYYGPSISLGFFFGNGGWWHGPAFGSAYRYEGGVRVYDSVHVRNVYSGGSFRGHDYVAPAEHGGYQHSSQNYRHGGGSGYHGGGNYGHDRGGDDRGGRG